MGSLRERNGLLFFDFRYKGIRCREQTALKNFDGTVADLTMHASEINNLVDTKTGDFHRKMYFDDHLFDIYKYEIDLSKNSIKIKARIPTKSGL